LHSFSRKTTKELIDRYKLSKSTISYILSYDKPNEPNLSSLCVQGIFQADSGITISLTGFPKLKSTKLLKRYKTIIHNHDSIFGP
jgi:hypothetical protein